MRFVAMVTRVVVSLVLGSSAGAKLWTGYEPMLLLPAWAFWGTALMELLAGVAIWTRWERIVRWLVACGCIIGVLWLALFPATRCGCFGSQLELSPQIRLVLLSLLGCASLGTELLARRQLRSQ
jgi:hypothetical protein